MRYSGRWGRGGDRAGGASWWMGDSTRRTGGVCGADGVGTPHLRLEGEVGEGLDVDRWLRTEDRVRVRLDGGEGEVLRIDGFARIIS